ncbi:purple acid phosphatase family protein [Clostridium paridis]|uniref:Metallophosphoesterase family protein n=1 Tax=Clostridium paridis TaxID=2803863 RepID=A0A937FIZ5_9CLOT|nr:metallophosphoesterase family protein [Clostridium paridis]MBL4934073.1 metallophosphoesterase family protein [Clostridium paridis]
MKKKILSLTISLSIAMTLFSSTVFKVNAETLTYNETTINENLNATVVPDHIVLNWTEDPSTTQTITWRTSKDVNAGEVKYRVKGSTDFTTLNVDPSNIKLFSTVASDTAGSMKVFSVTIKGLQSGTTYEYIVGDGTNFSNISTFKTEVSNNSKTKFLIFGDSQSGDSSKPIYAPWHDTVQKAYSENPDANFMVNIGDLVEQGQNYQHWNNWFNAANGVINNIPEMVVQGNHETYVPSGGSSKPEYFTNQFSVPNNGPFGYEGQVYSYNYGNVHFVVLDSQEDEEAPSNDNFLKTQADWLEQDLSANKQKWTIVMFHKTPYYNKKTRNNPAVKDIFTPVIDKHHVDVVLNGHDHGLSRTYAINGDNYYTDYSKGTVYYVTGRSGNKFYTDLSNKTWDAFFQDTQDSPTYEVADVVDGKLTIKAYKYSTTNPAYSNSTLVDTLVIDKDNPNNSTSLTLNKNDKTKLSVAGSVISDYDVDVVNNKAYVDPSKIAEVYKGTYDKTTLTLTINSKKYVFASSDLLNNDASKVNLDALYKSGIDCKYNSDLNVVLIDFTGRVDTTGFTGFVIGSIPNSGTNPPSNGSNPSGNNGSSTTPSNNTSSNAGNSNNSNLTNLSSSSLPKTGSVIGMDLIIVLGITIILSGICVLNRKRISEKIHKIISK